MNSLEVTEYHISTPDILKQQIEIRKGQQIAKHSDKLSNVMFQWIGNIASFSADVNYTNQKLNISISAKIWEK